MKKGIRYLLLFFVCCLVILTFNIWWKWLGEYSNQLIALSSLIAAGSIMKRFLWDEQTRFNVNISFPEEPNAQNLPQVSIWNKSYFDISIKSVSLHVGFKNYLFSRLWDSDKKLSYNAGEIIIKAKTTRTISAHRSDKERLDLLSFFLANNDPAIYAIVETENRVVKTSNCIHRSLQSAEKEELKKYLDSHPDIYT